MRERLAAHRNNAVCASCHRTIDPVGFSLENFNAVGQWRDYEGEGEPIDASGALPGVGEFRGVSGLEDALLSRPELFAGDADRETADVCAWAEASSTTTRPPSARSCATRRKTDTASRRSSWAS